MDVKRGDLYMADLDPVKGSEQGGIRPVLIISNDINNKSTFGCDRNETAAMRMHPLILGVCAL